MKKREVLFFSGLLLLTAVIFIGCSKKPAAGAAADPYANLPMEISVTMFDRGQVASSEGTYEDNRWTKWINENSPVKVKFVPVARTQSTAQINALFAAGTAPDLVWEFGKGFMDTLYAQGVIQPLDEYIEKYSTVYRDYLKAHPELVPFLLAEDGKMYGMTSARNILNIPNHAMWIRQDWLDKFNMAMPTTTDEVVTFMRRVRDEDPDGNRVKDTWGIGFNYNAPGIFRALFGEPMNAFMISNGRFVDWTSTQGYKDHLAFRAMLYKEGFVDPEYITDTNYARQRQLLVTGKTGIYLGGWDMPPEWRELKQNVPSANWVPFEPWTTTQGKHGLFQEPPAHYMICLNANSKNPKAVMAYVDWLISDGWFTLLYGEEGRHYRMVNGIPQTIDPDLNKIERDYSGEYAILHQNQPTVDWFPILAAEDALSQEYAKVRMIANEVQLKNKYDRIPYTPTSDNLNRFSTETAAQITALETNIITGTIGLDEGIRQIDAYKKSFDWDAVNKEKDDWYQKNKALLQ